MNTATIWAAVVALVAVLAAGITLALSGMEATAIVGFLTALITVAGGLVAMFDKLTTVHRVNAQQDEKLDVIEKRTNGELDKRIEEAIETGLNRRFGPPLTPTSGAENGIPEQAVRS